MRVTTNLIHQTLLRQTQQAAQKLFEAQERLATQKKLNRVSDDPIAAQRVLDSRTGLRQTDQYLRNIQRADSLATVYDSTLNQAGELLTRAKELLLSQTSSAAATNQTREAVAIELIALRKELIDISNYQLNGQYIYSGAADRTPAFTDINIAAAPGGGNTGGAIIAAGVSNPVNVQIGDVYQIVFTGPATFDVVNVTDGFTVLAGQAYVSGQDILFDGIRARISDDTAPPAAGDTFDLTVNPPGVYQGDSQVRRVEIDKGRQETINLTGNTVFQGVGVPGGEDIFQLFDDAINALRANDVATLDAALDRFDNSLNQVVNHRSVIGARQNLFASTVLRHNNVLLGLTTLVSQLEDVDIADAVSEFNRAQNSYEASLNAMGQVIQPSLLDFLS